DGNVDLLESSEVQPLNFSNLRGQITVSQKNSQGWQIWAEELGFKLNDLNWAPANHYLEYHQDEHEKFEFQSSALNLLLLSEIASNSGILPEQAQSVLSSLAPSGKITNTKMNFELSEGDLE